MASRRADDVERMLTIPPPMSNAERQRLFQLRHPGYDRRRKARQRGALKKALQAKRRQMVLDAQATAAQTVPPPAVETPAPRLMLPAPVENLEMAQIDALAASLAARRRAELLCESAPEPALRAR